MAGWCVNTLVDKFVDEAHNDNDLFLSSGGAFMPNMVRVDEQLHAKLRQLAESENRPIGQVIEEAVKQYERQKFWSEVNASLKRLRADPKAWQEYQEEIALLEGGSMDGLENEEPYYTPEEEEAIRAEYERAQGR